MCSWRNYCAVVEGVIVQLAPKGVVGEVGGANKKCFGAKRSSWRSRRS